MPLRQKYGLRRTRGVITDQTLHTDPVEHEESVSAGTYTLYTITITRDELVKGGRARYVTLTLDSKSSSTTSTLSFYKDGVEQTPKDMTIATAYDTFVFTFTVDNWNRDMTVAAKFTETGNNSTFRENVIVTVGREVMDA